MITPLDIFSWETWVLIGSVIFLLRWYIHKQWRILKDLQIPHDPPSILNLGNLRSLFKNHDSFFMIDFGHRKKYGPIYGSYNWLSPRITVGDPELIKQIMIKEASTFRDRQRSFSKVNGKDMNSGLTAASGDQWRRIRNSITPTFSTAKMKGMFSIMEQCTDKTVRILHKKVENEGGKFEAKELKHMKSLARPISATFESLCFSLFEKLSMDTLCCSAFGVSVSSEEGDSELVKKSKEFFSTNFFGIFGFIFLIFPWTERIAEKLNYGFLDQYLTFHKRLIDIAIKEKKVAKTKARTDILQGMLDAEISDEDLKNGKTKGVTRSEIRGNAILMLIAGYETTANTMSILTYCITSEPGVQEKLYEEISETKQKFGGLTYDAVHSMKYLDMCMKEALRLYGAVPRNSRYTDVEITLKGITIPAGTHVDIPFFAIHHDEEYWPDPWKFIPERFEDMNKFDPILYQPFGAGPRICIGQRFAVMEIKLAICQILMNFELSTCDDTPKPPLTLTFHTSMHPKDDIFLKVSPRNKVTAKESDANLEELAS